MVIGNVKEAHTGLTLASNVGLLSRERRRSGRFIVATAAAWEYYPGDGSVIRGCLPLAPQSKLPESTITPPTWLPCPPIHFVALSTMMSAPCCVREVEMVCKVGFEL
jgi:hypothetical protein